MAEMKRWSDWYPDPRQTARWKRVRRLVRSTYPRCEAQGCNQLSEEVHHIIPITHPLLGRVRAFDLDNLRAVCKACHRMADRDEVSWKPRSPASSDSPHDHPEGA